MGWGGMGTPLPHPNFISKFIIIFPAIRVKNIFTTTEKNTSISFIEYQETQLCTI